MTLGKREKRIIGKMYRQSPWRGIRSLMDEERIGDVSEDGIYFSEYGFLPEKMNKYSDEEIAEWINENMREEIRSPYDCTGLRHTYWIHFHRNPCGLISYVHSLGIDL